jgi:hypothetical protein
MYNYWSNADEIKGKFMILISKNLPRFNNGNIKLKTTAITPVVSISSCNQANQKNPVIFYYQIVKAKAS